MKKIIVLCLALVALAFTSSAQTNSNAGFISAAESYLTTFNTNLTWLNTSFEFSTGYRQLTGVGAQNESTLQKDLGLWNIGADIQYSGVGSAVNGAQAQVGYDLIQHYDTVVEADIRGGFGLNPNLERCGEIEPAILLKKLQTQNTATEIGISLPVYFRGKLSTTPTFLVKEVVKF